MNNTPPDAIEWTIWLFHTTDTATYHLYRELTIVADSFDEAVKKAREQAKPGEELYHCSRVN